MKLEIKVPQLPESVSEATLLQWNKKVGDAVTRDENLIDLETDKVVLELPAPVSGVLREILIGNGAIVKANDVLAILDTEATIKAVARQETPRVSQQSKMPADSVAALPAARKMMAEKNIDAANVEGTGRGGRITKNDVAGKTDKAAVDKTVLVAADTTSKAASVAAIPSVSGASPEGRIEQRVPMSRLRQRVAERLVQSQSTAAILTTFNEVNMQAVMDLRANYRDRFEKNNGVRLGFMGFFIKAVVYALKKFPIVNASIDGNDIVYHGYYDIGVAVGTPRGLVVPIIRDADQLSFAEIEKRIADFGKRAQEGKLTIEELTGGTFTISNGGVFGSLMSTPIINPPQSAILGVHATKERPVVENGQIVIRPMNYLALSYDHRIIDGRESVLTLVAIKEALEDPTRILLDV
ncbi:MAG: 2-oxoglutarate dehydrogenase complex dihydrolipoyllysine-residue succinyltransferase [Burkholderiales bacterium]|jgi:2-oxoglutarate dehydrogenase E2 component (dihydrolipoamide succinyltransferase)|nr:2-oxoglutarate dehydrogenase complex dihydrolipoyllysine-residue succinyltransferase [Burkholderiales bacterium]